MLDCDQPVYYNACSLCLLQYQQHHHIQSDNQHFNNITISCHHHHQQQQQSMMIDIDQQSLPKSIQCNNVDLPFSDATNRLIASKSVGIANNLNNNNNDNNKDDSCNDDNVLLKENYLTEETLTRGAMVIDKPTVIAMVGLPARGKTFISKKILQYLYNQLGLVGRVFNVGEYRRLATDYTAHDFFRSDNKQALAMRNKLAIDALEDMCSWLAKGEDRVAIYDATNSTRDRREIIHDTVVCKYNYNLLFIESICDDKSIIEANIMMKSHSPDYKHLEDKAAAINDFKQRIEHYRSRYQSLDCNDLEECNYSFVQIFNAGQRLYNHHCKSQIQTLLFHYLLDLYVK